MCLYPIMIKNKKYESNKKNKGNIPTIKDERERYVTASCGRCIECLKQKGSEWRIRMMEEVKHNKDKAYFVTFTFADEGIEEVYEVAEERQKEYENIYNVIATVAVRRFLERWRKKHGRSVKHWLTTELGGKTSRIHLHGILWTDKCIDDINTIWKYGHTWIGEYVNEKTINYIVKYVSKIDVNNKKFIPKILCSPGIGKGFLETKQAELIKKGGKDIYRYENGAKGQLPIYYKNKIFTEEERTQQFIEKLDKEERYILGEKLKFRAGNVKDYEIYSRKLKDAQNKQIRLGYNKRKWKEKDYVKQLKKLNNGREKK